MVHQVEQYQALYRCPALIDILLVVDIKSCTKRPQDRYKEELATIIAAHGLENQNQNF